MLHQHLSPKGLTMAASVIALAEHQGLKTWGTTPEHERAQIRALRMEGVSPTEIAARFKLPVFHVCSGTRGYAPLRKHKEPSEAWKQQLLEHMPWMRRLAASITRDSNQTSDLVQDTMLRALESEWAFETGTNLGAWLTTMMRNLYKNQSRKRREVEDPDGVLAAYRLTCPPEQNYNLILERLSEALNRLPPAQAEAIRLACIQGMKYDDVGDLLDCSTGTIKSRVSRGREALAKLLGIDGSDLATDGVLAASLESRDG